MSFGDGGFNLLFHRLKVERRPFLHRRKVDGGGGKLAHLLLHIDKTPEFTRHEFVHVGGRSHEQICNRPSLERILLGPAHVTDGSENLVGALRQSMAALGARTIREMQAVEMVYAPSTQTEGKSWQRAR